MISNLNLALPFTLLNRQFGTKDLRAFGVKNPSRLKCGRLFYCNMQKETQRTALPHIQSIGLIQRQDCIQLDAATPLLRNLELTQNLSGGTENTLASVLDECVTPMGSRLLKRWIHPALFVMWKR